MNLINRVVLVDTNGGGRSVSKRFSLDPNGFFYKYPRKSFFQKMKILIKPKDFHREIIVDDNQSSIE